MAFKAGSTTCANNSAQVDFARVTYTANTIAYPVGVSSQNYWLINASMSAGSLVLTTVIG